MVAVVVVVVVAGWVAVGVGVAVGVVFVVAVGVAVVVAVAVGVAVGMTSPKQGVPESLVFRLRKRAEIRRQIPARKSVQEGSPDRIADLLEETANALEEAEAREAALRAQIENVRKAVDA